MIAEALTVPVRACARVVREDVAIDGHEDEHPVDRSCCSEIHYVPLSRRDPVRMCNGEWWHDHLDVALRWPPREAVQVVVLNHEGDDGKRGDASWEYELTFDEARALRNKLDELLGVGWA